MVAMPSAARSFAVALPTPHSRVIGSGARNSASPPSSTTTRPSGLRRSEATLAMNLLAASPAEAVSPVSPRMRRLISRTASGAGPNSDAVPVRSTNASSTETGSTRGEKSPRMAMICREARTYLSMSTGRKTPSGHSRAAFEMGIAELTPNTRASYEHADTTPRPLGSAPTMTGRPRSSGRSRCSTDA